MAEAPAAVNLVLEEGKVSPEVPAEIGTERLAAPPAAENEPLARTSLQLPEERDLATGTSEQPPTGTDPLAKAEEIMNSEPPGLPAIEQTLVAAATISPDAVETPGTDPRPEPEENSSALSVVSDKSCQPPNEPSTSSPVAPAVTAPAAPSMSRSTVPAAVEPEINEEPETASVPAPAAAEPEAPAGDSPAIAPSGDSASLKTLQKVAADAAVHAGQAYVEAGKQAQLTIKDLLSLREKEGPPVTLSVDQIATAVFFLLVGLHLLFLPLFLPSTFRLLYSLVWGLLIGLGISYLFYHNTNTKKETNELLGTELGLKGVQLVAGAIPAIFSVADTEKMEWLNALLEEVWPFVDKAVCAMIKEQTAQMMPSILASLPGVLAGTVKSVGFKHLTFGAAPFSVENIRVDREGKNGMVLELSIKWCGDPNITLAIEVPGGQKLCPRVLDISVAATIRVVLQPLVPRLPGVVAMMATIPKTPLIKYRLDFGKALGGSVAPMMVTPVINYFIRGVLDRMLVWPNRIVVPILQESAEDAAAVQALTRRIRGMIRVCVVRAKTLKDVDPTDEVSVELTTDTEYYESTPPSAAVSAEELAAVEGKIEKLANTEIVTWDHFFYLLVQEPETQNLRLEVFDMSAGKRVPKGTPVAQIVGRRSVGRALVKLSRPCKAAVEGSREPIPMRVQLGEGDWGSPGGPGKGAGTMNLQMTYFPCEYFTREEVLSASKGIITVRLLAISGLSPGANNSVVAYARYQLKSNKLAGKPSFQTGKKYWTLAGHVNLLRAQLRKLELARETDLRDGNEAAAEAKAGQIRQIQADLDVASNKNNKANRERSVGLDYTMEQTSLTAFYQATEKIAETGEDNCITIKVVQEGRVKKTAETIGSVDVPVSVIKNARSLNPQSRKWEEGLYTQKWRNYDPDTPGRLPPEEEWGLRLEGSVNTRVWMVMRFVPCIEAVPTEMDDEDEAAFVNALPSTINPPEA